MNNFHERLQIKVSYCIFCSVRAQSTESLSLWTNCKQLCWAENGSLTDLRAVKIFATTSSYERVCKTRRQRTWILISRLSKWASRRSSGAWARWRGEFRHFFLRCADERHIIVEWLWCASSHPPNWVYLSAHKADLISGAERESFVGWQSSTNIYHSIGEGDSLGGPGKCLPS
jgi:hypothetical protein